MSSPKPFHAAKVDEHVTMLENRLRKKLRTLKKRFAKQNVTAFRVYDWDIPEVRATVDWLSGYAVVSEYVREQTRDVGYLDALCAATSRALGIDAERVVGKERRTGARGARYPRLTETDARVVVHEGALQFLVNPYDYVDCGLFLDHRTTRSWVGASAQRKRFLNLFAYTGAFTCHAVAGGCERAISVDANPRYIEWTRANLEANQLLRDDDELVTDDVGAFLVRAEKRVSHRFDVIVVDPPSFSSRFQWPEGPGDFDVLRDHSRLLELVLKVARPGAQIWFSTNHQRFEPRFSRAVGEAARERTRESIPSDFQRRPHRLWEIVVADT